MSEVEQKLMMSLPPSVSESNFSNPASFAAFIAVKYLSLSS
jgi:hypothetical protein